MYQYICSRRLFFIESFYEPSRTNRTESLVLLFLPHAQLLPRHLLRVADRAPHAPAGFEGGAGVLLRIRLGLGGEQLREVRCVFVAPSAGLGAGGRGSRAATFSFVL